MKNFKLIFKSPVLIVFALVFFASAKSSHSKSYTFKPNWTEGETKVISFKERQREYENGELTKDTTLLNEAEATVLKSNPDSVKLEILFKDQALVQLIQLFEQNGYGTPKTYDLSLIYWIQKTNGKSRLDNWEDTKSFMEKNLDQMKSLIPESDTSALMDKLFEMLTKAYTNRDFIEAFAQPVLDILTGPMGHSLKLQEPMTQTSQEKDPFQPNKTIESKATFTLLNVDKSTKLAQIKRQVKIEEDSLLASLQSMMVNLVKSLGLEDSVLSEMKNNPNLLHYKMKFRRDDTFRINYKTGWVRRFTSQVVMTTKEEDGEFSKRITSITVSVE